jgi:hypothetical protein
VSFTAPMSRRRKVLVTVVGVALILFGAATLWQSNDGGVPRYARVLLLDPATGKTVREWRADGGYAVVALLAGGRVAVATLDSCPDGKGGHVTVLDRSLQRVISRRALAPCIVARIDPPGLRSRLGEDVPALRPDYGGGSDVTVHLGGGKVVETYTTQADGSGWLTAITAFDASGRPGWKLSGLGHLGIADARGGRLVVPVFGTFTPGSD